MNTASRLAGIGCALAAVSVPVGGQDSGLGMLDQLQTGVWELRQRPPGNGTERICVVGGKSLVQLRHQRLNCESRTIEDSATEVAVHYTCRGNGYGLTRIRRESDRLIQIDSQGVADGRPFSFSAEGRHMGDCPA